VGGRGPAALGAHRASAWAASAVDERGDRDSTPGVKHSFRGRVARRSANGPRQPRPGQGTRPHFDQLWEKQSGAGRARDSLTFACLYTDDRTATGTVFAGPSNFPALGQGKGHNPWAPFPRVEAVDAAWAALRFTSSCIPGINDRVLRKS
jgi:hypothetical protein